VARGHRETPGASASRSGAVGVRVHVLLPFRQGIPLSGTGRLRVPGALDRSSAARQTEATIRSSDSRLDPAGKPAMRSPISTYVVAAASRPHGMPRLQFTGEGACARPRSATDTPAHVHGPSSILRPAASRGRVELDPATQNARYFATCGTSMMRPIGASGHGTSPGVNCRERPAVALLIATRREAGLTAFVATRTQDSRRYREFHPASTSEKSSESPIRNP